MSSTLFHIGMMSEPQPSRWKTIRLTDMSNFSNSTNPITLSRHIVLISAIHFNFHDDN